MAIKTTRIKALYQRMPLVNCRGLCWDQCRPLLVSRAERYMMVLEGGEPQKNGDFCAYLADGRCSIYDSRPMICRLFGAEQGSCPHGCEVAGGPLTFEQGELFIRGLEDIDGRSIPMEETSLDEHLKRLLEIEERAH